MLLIHQGHQSKVKVVAKTKSTGLYSLGLWGILPQKILIKYTFFFFFFYLQAHETNIKLVR